MHEFELGVWKSFFTHLIRVLYAAAPDGHLVEALNERCGGLFQVYESKSAFSPFFLFSVIVRCQPLA